MDIGAVKRKSVVDQVVDILKEFIMSGEVKAGDKLPTEMELCEKLSVGRGTVREAIRILQAIGFVEIQSGRGAFVARTTEPAPEDLMMWFRENEVELIDVLEVRTAIEPLAVQLAIRHSSAAELEELREIHAHTLEAVNQNDVHSIATCDELFHTFIVKCSRNKLLISINKQISEYLTNFRHKTFYIPSNAKNLIVPHTNILQAFIDKDPQRGQEYMLEHLQWVKQDLERSKEL